MLHQLLTSPSKSFESHLLSNNQSTRSDIIDNNTPNPNKNPNNRSPHYRPRHSYSHSSETTLIPTDNSNSISGNNVNK
jgi:hypothetical protein